MKNLMRLDLQHFAEPVGGVEPPAGGQQQTQIPSAQQAGQQTQAPVIDYDKIAQLVPGEAGGNRRVRDKRLPETAGPYKGADGSGNCDI